MVTTMRPLRLAAAAALVSSAIACGGGSGGSSPRPVVAEDERGSVGVPPTADEYCTKLGFSLADGQCKFPDGTGCEPWSFYRGECGQAHTYCNQRGGAISTKTEDMGTWTAVYGVCDLNGKQCKESSFIQTGSCP